MSTGSPSEALKVGQLQSPWEDGGYTLGTNRTLRVFCELAQCCSFELFNEMLQALEHLAMW